MAQELFSNYCRGNSRMFDVVNNCRSIGFKVLINALHSRFAGFLISVDIMTE